VTVGEIAALASLMVTHRLTEISIGATPDSPAVTLKKTIHLADPMPEQEADDTEPPRAPTIDDADSLDEPLIGIPQYARAKVEVDA
jgi:hypothetical protein